MQKQLKELELEQINEDFVVIYNEECGYPLGLMDIDDAFELFNDYNDPFPLLIEPVISNIVMDLIEDNCILSEDEVKEDIYEHQDR